MKTTAILCDECDRDITFTGNSIDYRILLESEMVPHKGNTVTDMMIYPQIEQSRHFCRTSCLKSWVEKHL